MEKKELYEQYGKAIIDLEIIQQRVGVLKQAIAEELNKSKAQPKKEEKK